MSEVLLKRYIKLALETRMARVPNQLLDAGEDQDTAENDQENVQEFSAAGGIVGYGAPLGVDPDKLGRKKNSKRS